MDISDLRMNQLVRNGRELLKVGTVYSDDLVSAQVVYPIPPRTTVRFYTAAEAAAWGRPSAQLVHKYDDAWGFVQ